MPVTEFYDSEHYGLFLTNANKLDSSTTKRVRMSSLVLAALRSAGFLDNMDDGLVPPVDTSRLWLDKSTDPAVLKEYDPVGFAWVQVTSQTLFGRLPFRGPWDDEPIYRIGDLVFYGTNIWIARLPSQNHPPVDDLYWDVFIDGSSYASTDDQRIVNALQPANGKTAFQTKALAQAATVPAAVKRISTQFLNPTYASLPTLVGGGEYKRVSLASLGSYPASSYFRTVDRFMPDGTTDNTNGGYWLLDEERPDPLQFGAKGDFSTNDRQAIVDAGAYASARAGGVGGCVFFSSSVGHVFASGITLPNGLSWKGVGQIPLKFTGTSGAAVTMYGNDGTLERFAFSYGGVFGTNVVGVQIGIDELAQRQTVRDCTFWNFATSIYHKCAVACSIENNIISNSATYGILFENTVTADAGDAGVCNNVISNSLLAAGTGSAGFRYQSGGGLRFIGNKILNFQRGFDMQIPNGAATVDLMFVGNSIENQSVAAMRMGRSGTTGSFGSITITGNEVAGTVQGIAINVGASNGIIIGNTFNLCSQAAIVINSAPNWQVGHNNYAACAANVIDARSDGVAEAITTEQNGGFHVSSATTYTYSVKVGVPNLRSARVDLFVEGIVQGVGFFARQYSFISTNTGATMTATVLKDQAVGAALDIDFDTTTDPDAVIIGFRRNAAGGGTVVDGSYSVKVDGRVGSFIRLT